MQFCEILLTTEMTVSKRPENGVRGKLTAATDMAERMKKTESGILKFTGPFVFLLSPFWEEPDRSRPD